LVLQKGAFSVISRNDGFQAVAENFLGQCPGGRAEPIGSTLKPSTHKSSMARSLHRD
jgi:hypothetical protein